MRVLLVRTGSRHERATPPLDLLSVAAHLRRNRIDVTFVDARRDGLQPATVAARAGEADLVLLGGRDDLDSTARAMRDISISAPIGSLGVESDAVDFVIVGDPEETALDVARAGGATGVVGAARVTIEDVDALPIPALDLVAPLAAYGGPVPVRTARENPWRPLSAERVLLEVRQTVERHGAREIVFVDPVFDRDPDRARAILDGLVREGLYRSVAFRARLASGADTPAPLLPEGPRPERLVDHVVPGRDDADCLGDGWHGPELTEDESYRWMGGRARVWLPYRTDARVTVEAEAYLPPGVTSRELTIEADGRAVGRFDFEPSSRRREVTVEIAGPEERGGVRRIDLVPSGADRPSAVETGSRDGRDLAFRVFSIRTADRPPEPVVADDPAPQDELALSTREVEELRDGLGRPAGGEDEVRFVGSWRHEGDGVRVGRREEREGRFADLTISLAGEDGRIALSWLDDRPGDVAFLALNDSLAPLGRVTLPRSGEGGWRVLRLPGTGPRRCALVLLTPGTDVTLRPPSVVRVTERRLNLGCGRDIRPDFLNLDMNPWPGVDVICDVARLPFAPGTAREILADDILEHFPHARSLAVLSEWRRVLEVDGAMVIRTPSLEGVVDLYRRRPTGWERPEGPETDPIVERLYGGQDFEGNTHFTIYDAPALAAHLAEVGLHPLELGFDGEDVSNLVTVARRVE